MEAPVYDFGINLFSGLVGAILVFIAQFVYRRIRESGAPYTGTWHGSILDNEGKVTKQDIMEIKQTGLELSGTIRRIFPEDQRHRKWRFEGRLRGTSFFAVFWSLRSDVQSYGCWYLRQIHDDSFDGYYLSLQRTISENGDAIVEQVRPVHVKLKRVQSLNPDTTH